MQIMNIHEMRRITLHARPITGGLQGPVIVWLYINKL